MTALFPVIPFPEPEDESLKEEYENLKVKLRKQESQIRTSLTFPSIVMSGFAGEFAKVYASTLESPEHAFYMAAITCLGSILAGNVRLNTELKSDPRLYVVFVGPSGMSRKSTASDKAINFFLDYTKTFRLCVGAGSAEGLYAEINDRKWDKRLLLYYDEFQQFVNKCKIESSVLLQMVNTLFESNRYQNRVLKKAILLDDAYLCLMSASTEQTFEECWEASFTNIGFNNRLFIVPLPSVLRNKSFPPPVPEEEKQRLATMLTDILDKVGNDAVYSFTPAAYNYFDKWYKKLDTSEHSIRIETYALRLICVLAANDGKEEVDLATVIKATTLCNWQISVRKKYNPISAENPYAKMEEKIRRALSAADQPLNLKTLQRATHSYRSGLRVFNNALDNLRNEHEVEKDRNGKFSLVTRQDTDE